MLPERPGSEPGNGGNRPQAVIRGGVTICEFFCLAIRYALLPLRARSCRLSERRAMSKNKVGVFFLLLALGSTLAHFWSQRNVDLKIASVTFRFPNPAIVSASSLRAISGALDSTHGAFLEIPNGPYYGKWGVLLQSSAERRANGFPSPFDVTVAEGTVGSALQLTSFGWYSCTELCGRDVWHFRRKPTRDDSTYSVGSIICHETEICHLFFSYRDVDVQISLQQSQIENAPANLKQAAELIASLDVTRK